MRKKGKPFARRESRREKSKVDLGDPIRGEKPFVVNTSIPNSTKKHISNDSSKKFDSGFEHALITPQTAQRLEKKLGVTNNKRNKILEIVQAQSEIYKRAIRIDSLMIKRGTN